MISKSDPIPPAKPYIPEADVEEMKKRVASILRSGRLTLGDYTREFESKFADHVHVRHAVAVNSGTSALEISLRALNLDRGDEVIVPTNTFGATAAAVIFAGGTPVITDVAPSTMTLDAEHVQEAITEKTRGVIAVHIGGLICPDIYEIMDLCKERDLFLLEDAAHAHGSKIDSRYAGSLGSAGCFSFYPTKVITSGEGGMITTDDDELAAAAVVMRDQGKQSFNSNVIIKLGYNWRLPEFSAALGVLQLRQLDAFIARRNEVAKLYDKAFDEIRLERVATPKNQINNYYKYTCYLPKQISRDHFKELCRAEGVSYGGEVYWPSLHHQPAFQPFLNKASEFKNADEWGVRMANPPMFSNITHDQAERVIGVTKQALQKLGQVNTS